MSNGVKSSHTFRRRTHYFRLPVWAPFGTAGFDVSPEQRRQQWEDEDQWDAEREAQGIEADFRRRRR